MIIENWEIKIKQKNNNNNLKGHKRRLIPFVEEVKLIEGKM